MKRIITSVAILFAMAANAQELLSPVRSDLIPPVPKSAAIVEVQMPAPALLTGAASFAIPIHTIDVDGYTLPITLQYHSNGVKVFDQSAPLGLGWSLTPAFRATRTIMGRPDELYEFKHIGDIIGSNEPYYTAFQCMANQMATGYDTDVLYDSQHDIFTFALPGKTITRVLDATKTPYQFLGVDDSEYIVTTDNELLGITVTGPDGTIYKFGSPYEFQTTDAYSSQFRTGWALTEISLPSGQSINLAWEERNGAGIPMSFIGGATYVDDRNPSDFFNHTNPDEFVNSSEASGVISSSLPDNGMIRLKSISYPGGELRLNYGVWNATFIDRITIANSDSDIRTYSLSYTQTGYAHWVLSSVDTGDGDDPYTFDYYGVDGGVLNSHAQDWWGYYNAIETNNSLEPMLTLHELVPNSTATDRYFTIGQADRSVNEDAMKADILKSITFPTGAISEFEYETHRFAPTRMNSFGNIREDSDPLLDHGGGLRVKTVTMKNGADDDAPQTVRYEYSLASVRAVPSAATFINISPAVMPKGDWLGNGNTYCPVRLVNDIPVSDYMRYDMGETPLWYPMVTEIHAEGKVEHVFSDILPRPNAFGDRFGMRTIIELRKVFSTGPQEVCRTIYKGTSGAYEKVARERSIYTAPSMGAITSTHILRERIMMGTQSKVQPDFDEGHLMRQVGPYGFTPDILEMSNGDPVFPYSATAYGIEMRTERLQATESVVYHGSDSMVVRKEYEYEPGTSIVCRTTVSCGDDSRVTEYDFARTVDSPMARAMVAANIINVPLKARTSRDGATTCSEAEYTQLGSRLFRPRRIRTWHTGATDTILSPEYSWAAHRLGGYTDADGVSAAYLWGYGGTLPVYRIDGMSHEQAQKNHGNTLGAENYSFQSSVGQLYTRALYDPGIGVTALTQPFGATERYEYDAAHRLSKTEVDGLGTVATYEYRIAHDGDNSATAHRWLDSGGTDKHKTVTTYDHRGRPVESRDYGGGASSILIAMGNVEHSGAVSVFSDYDAMGRLSRVSVPSASRPSDDASWTDYSYEASPRGVRQAETKAGEEWKSAGKSATVKTAFNTAAMPWSCPRLSLGSDGSVVHKGDWPTGTLSVTESVDEDGHAVYEASDFEGRLMMRREGADGDWLSTYYIYDSFGRLRRVLQPILGARDYDADHADLEDFAFEYRYDDADRIVYERTPGCTPTLRRYTRAGRLFAEHLPAMPEGEWRLTFYDALGRTALQGKASVSDSELDAMSANVKVTADIFASASMGYRRNGGFPDGFSVTSAWYYDNYNFLTGHSSSGDLTFDASTAYSASSLQTPFGLATGTADCGDDGNLRYSATYYDALGRVVQTRSAAPEGNVTVSTAHTYFGAPEATRTILERPDTTYTFETAHTYDIGERSTKTQYDFAGRSTTVNNTYDASGRVSRTDFGALTARTYTYDIHGWPVKTATLLPSFLIPGTLGNRGSISGDYYSAVALGDDLPAIKPPVKPSLLTEAYTEQMYYADGATPRYTGEMSGRTTTFGSRYDYRYDAHDRLIAADYTPADPDSDEDFSTAYTYDAIGRPLTLRRYGVTAIDGTIETFGILDDLKYTYSGALPASIARTSDATDFYGQTGARSTDLTFDGAGLLTEDTGRKITEIQYNHLGLPTSTTVSSKSSPMMSARMISSNIYSSSGNLIKTRYLTAVINTPTPTGTKTHIANFTFGSRRSAADTLTRVDFPGGYFDAKGGVHWMLTDAIGSVEMVVDNRGSVEQHTGYYPYGEPWRNPAGQPYLFGAKERRSYASLNDYDFHARFYTAANTLWHAPDTHAGKYHHLSPWTFCAANPIRYSDPTGKEWTKKLDEKGNLSGYEWVNPKDAYDKEGNLLPGHYQQAIFFSKEGSKGTFDPENDFNIGTSTATVYKADGTTETFDACTNPSDPKKYATIPAREYEAAVGKHKASSPKGYTALRVGDIGTTNFYDNQIELGKPNPSNPKTTKIIGANIHKPLSNNFTGVDRNGKPISVACILIDADRWDDFIKIFTEHKGESNIIGIIIER